MGIVRTEESRELEMEDFRRMLVACAGLNRSTYDEEFIQKNYSNNGGGVDDVAEKVVCVTSGVSYLGVALVNRLLLCGFSVRVIIDNQDDVEKLREMETSGEMRIPNNKLTAVMAKLTDIHGISQAIDGCHGVFHTSAFDDPAGLSGYTKSMAEIEVKVAESVIKACARTPSVRNCVLTSSLLACIWRIRNCVLTSSLLACIWRNGALHDLSDTISHNSWSDESLCVEKKLWYAFGKLKAEKTAWKIAKDEGIKLTTICPGLITGPEFIHRNPTATIAYLKGGKEMFADGILATVDIFRLAKAHVQVFGAMNKNASGRYICFNSIVETEYEAEKLTQEMGLPVNKIIGEAVDFIPARFELSNRKLTSLMSRTIRPCYNESL